MEIVNVSVRLRRVTMDDGQDALDAMEGIFDEYEIPDDKRLELWKQFQVLACDVLIRFGEFSPDVGYSEHNGEV